MGGAAATLSSLGTFGVDSFTAMLNPGESAILAVGRTVEKVVPRDRGLAVVPTLHADLHLRPPRRRRRHRRRSPWPSWPSCWKGDRMADVSGPPALPDRRRGARRRRRLRDRPRLRRGAAPPPAGRRVVADLKPDPGDAAAIAVDVRDRDAVGAAVAAAVDRARHARHRRLRRRHRPRHPDARDRARASGTSSLGVNLDRRLQRPAGLRPPHPRRRLVHRDLLDRLRLAGPRARPLLRGQGRPRGAGPLGRARARPRRRSAATPSCPGSCARR